MSKYTRINHQIRAQEVRVIEADEGNLGIMSLGDALRLAEDKGLDLIEISPNAKPPITKIIDYGKWQYDEKRKAKAQKAGSKATETKSIQVKIGTGEHDLSLKAGRAGKWLKEGHRVKVELFLPGRTKYLDKTFLEERLTRFLNLIPDDYKVADSIKKGPKGLFLVVEKGKKN